MNICLKSLARQNAPQHANITLQARLPEYIRAPCELSCDYYAVSYNTYYLLMLDIVGRLSLTCQRCLKPFYYDYKNNTKLAVCGNDSMAEILLEQYECVVSADYHVDLIDILTDDLYLFLPEKHLNSSDCDTAVSGFITS